MHESCSHAGRPGSGLGLKGTWGVDESWAIFRASRASTTWGAHGDRRSLGIGGLRKADDARGEHDEHLLVVHFFVILRKQIAQPGNFTQPWNTLQLIGQSPLNQT